MNGNHKASSPLSFSVGIDEDQFKADLEVKQPTHWTTTVWETLGKNCSVCQDIILLVLDYSMLQLKIKEMIQFVEKQNWCVYLVVPGLSRLILHQNWQGFYTRYSIPRKELDYKRQIYQLIYAMERNDISTTNQVLTVLIRKEKDRWRGFWAPDVDLFILLLLCAHVNVGGGCRST